MFKARVRLNHARGWRMPPDAVIADRTSPWANPFRLLPPTRGGPWIVRRGPYIWHVEDERQARRMSVDLYAAWLLEPAQRSLRDRMRIRFVGKRPACWCVEGTPCHATVIAALAATPLECVAA